MTEFKETDIGQIPSHWNLMTIDDIKASTKKSIISGPFGSNISAKYFVEVGVPVIRGNNLSLDIQKKFKDEGFVFISEEKAKELGTWAEKDDIIFTAVGTIGQVGILLGNEKYLKYIISNKQLRLRVNTELVEPLYAYYWFASPFMIDMILQRNTGSSVPLINLSVLKSLLIPLPPKEERISILNVLSSLDDKIDLLHRQNATLEKMAETLFRQWFVEEAKEEWENCNLEDLCSQVNSGGTPSTKIESYYNGHINWYSTKELNDNFLFESNSKITDDGLKNSSAKLFPKGTVVIAIYAAPTVGRLGILGNESAFNQAACGFIANDKICCKEFIYLFLKSQRDELNAMASGSAQQNLNVGKIKSYPAFIPDAVSMEQFRIVIIPMFKKIEKNTMKIRTLTALRDTLLPKLMSGEIRVEMEENTV